MFDQSEIREAITRQLLGMLFFASFCLTVYAGDRLHAQFRGDLASVYSQVAAIAAYEAREPVENNPRRLHHLLTSLSYAAIPSIHTALQTLADEQVALSSAEMSQLQEARPCNLLFVPVKNLSVEPFLKEADAAVLVVPSLDCSNSVAPILIGEIGGEQPGYALIIPYRERIYGSMACPGSYFCTRVSDVRAQIEENIIPLFEVIYSG